MVTVSPATVKIAGRAAVLDKISEITIPAEELDLTDATAPVTNTIDIREYLLRTYRLQMLILTEQ